jgi:hypothetical protein
MKTAHQAGMKWQRRVDRNIDRPTMLEEIKEQDVEPVGCEPAAVELTQPKNRLLRLMEW